MEHYKILKRGLAGLAALLVAFSLASCKKAPAAPQRIPAVPKLRVLFVGNSLTFVNDLPALTAGLAKARNSKMEYEMYAPGGYTLAQHSADAALLGKINEGNWNYVVLQEQSQIPAFPWAETQVFPFARKLSQTIRDANPGVKVAFYMTMARKNGDAQNGKYFPEVGTYAGMQKKLNEAYTRMALENQGVLVPVGEVWEKVREQDPALDLYGDEVHPNQAGTYLAACVFYAVLFADSPVGLPHPPQIGDYAAETIQKLAYEATKPAKPAL